MSRLSRASARVPGRGRVNSRRPVRFTFDGRSFEGFEGDTLASALLANGVHLMGRSFKYHRPRGPISAGSDEPNAIVAVGSGPALQTPNLVATQVEIYDGLKAQSQNRFPCLQFDMGAVNNLASPLLPSGFYYKTFMWPRNFWTKVYEPVIRRSAGLGVAPTEPDPDHYAFQYTFCDVLVAGGGASGLAAALAAAKAGAEVMLADETAEFGGSLLFDRTSRIDGLPASEWVERTVAALKTMPNVRLFTRTTVFNYGPHNMVALNQRMTDHLSAPNPATPRERLWQVRAKQVVIASGAIERPLVFEGNDRPGVMLASAAQTYLNRYGVACGRKAVIATADDSAYRVALDLLEAGVKIAAIADIRPKPDSELLRKARAAGIPVLVNSTVQRAHGSQRIHSVELAPVLPGGDVGEGKNYSCDLLLMAGGWTPSLHLFSQSKGKVIYSPELDVYLPGESTQEERSVGSCRGIYDLGEVLADGLKSGAAAAKDAGCDGEVELPLWEVTSDAIGRGGFTGALPRRGKGLMAMAFVDYQNDVTAKDVKLAVREGFQSIEHIKRYTTTGMATDQGKTSNLNALGIASHALGRPKQQIGLTTFRAPYTPVTFGAFSGHERGNEFDPDRRTPIDPWARSKGAVFEDVSLWRRARYFPQPGEDMDAAVARECLAVRKSVGIFDASTLGKIEVVGPDAAEFMNRMYVNAWTKLGVGKCRYGLMCRENGFVYDDGVVGRIAQDRFHVTTTTGGAAGVLNMMEDYLQTEWQDLDVWLTSTSEEWSVIAVQGPKAREVLAPLVDGLDISHETMPHMSVVEGSIGGIPMRLFRVSFSGELGFEVNVPPSRAREVWERIWEAGKPYGMTPYGTETMHVLRAEKGYIIVGQETDGTATPDDAGCGWAVSKLKKDFVGKRSLALPAMQDPDRYQLVGLYTQAPQEVLEEGAQLVANPNEVIPMKKIGHVTSSYHSATLGRSIALAMISGGRARMGETLYVPMEDKVIPVTVTSPVFYDAEGARLNV
ncbi:sarcosine oxidase subunit alpha [Acetobacter sp.]|jgi:sarcosine oxidase subunit alpha|uniref:sarcosine oxidase subunit alpha n=1 Tax=Acetobacter sp. TaxID=440 RepID=UPI0025C0DF00|nr:sarcosine oxidase subunit alpha [Acetobacter sp.]MCH4091000.1 sarcosine oxidase subunit alpha [Acetobacter sp.]MCI1300183.1 sarcosine oxidase subunit alpha [Acetobacter sp.]MCI1316149.1 sarcosine oxidase subunit alpha [Acetobacter sp.]